MGVLIIGAVLFWLYIRASDFWKPPSVIVPTGSIYLIIMRS